jgi:aspartate/tyrosine/aromatic aminotransferase
MFYPNNLKCVYTPNVTWSLHHNIIADAGFEEKNFRYYNPVTKAIDMDGLLEDLENMDDEQVLLMQTSAQNPSGVDPTHEQWHKIFAIVMRKQHFVFFDSAYQGFASDDYRDDTWSLKTLSKMYLRVMLA